MKNVTITLDDEVALWARVHAAENDTSVSRMVGEMLRDRMLHVRAYEVARDRYLSVAPSPLKLSGGYPDREAIHDRGERDRG